MIHEFEKENGDAYMLYLELVAEIIKPTPEQELKLYYLKDCLARMTTEIINGQPMVNAIEGWEFIEILRDRKLEITTNNVLPFGEFTLSLKGESS